MIRTAYRSKMRLWADSDELTPGRWFRAPPGAKMFPGPHRITSAWWRDPHRPDPEVGEVFEPKLRYDKGSNVNGYTGQAICGSEESIRTGGAHQRDPGLLTRANGSSPCCFGGPPGPVPLPRTPAGRLSEVPVSSGSTILFSMTLNSGNPPLNARMVLVVVSSGITFGTFDPDVTGWTRLLFDRTGSVGFAVFTRVSTGAEPDFYTITGFSFTPVSATLSCWEGPCEIALGALARGSGTATASVAPGFPSGSCTVVHYASTPSDIAVAPDDPLDAQLVDPGGSFPHPPFLGSWHNTTLAPGGESKAGTAGSVTVWSALSLLLWQ